LNQTLSQFTGFREDPPVWYALASAMSEWYDLSLPLVAVERVAEVANEMGATVLDAAFESVSHSLRVLRSDGAEGGNLQSRYADVDPQLLADALARAHELEEVAIEMAGANRGPRSDGSGPPLNRETLAARCPGFSDESYFWAMEDGFQLTR
jgi:hypothetical protein